ncbi:MAG: RHS repeat-associated core domain-containing protein, partial [Acidiferrobacter sp.]
LTVNNAARAFTGLYNSANELTSANNQTLTDNVFGELTSDGTDTFTWDAAHRLVSVTNTSTGTKTTYTDNGQGERVATTVQASGASPVTTTTLWCGATICAAFNAGNTLTAQYFPQGEVDGSQDYLYTRNNVGSVTALLTPQGTVAGQYSYSPYGQESTTASTTTPPPIPAFGYAGMVTDQSTGLNLTLYRAYDPQLRRWLSRDPVGALGGLVLLRAGLAMPVVMGGSGARWVGLNLAINRYPYVGNDPLNWVDPHGDITFRQWSFTLLSAYCIAIFHPADIPETPVVATPPSEVATLPITPFTKK